MKAHFEPSVSILSGALWAPRGQGAQAALGGGLRDTSIRTSRHRPEPCPGGGVAMAAPTLEQLPEEAGLLRTGSPGQADAPRPTPAPQPQPEEAAGHAHPASSG